MSSEPPGIFDVLATSANRMSNQALVLLEVAGLAGFLAIVAWTPQLARLALPCLSLSMFGLWGVTEHARRARDPLGPRGPDLLLSYVQTIAAAIGTIALAAAIFSLTGSIVGTIIL